MASSVTQFADQKNRDPIDVFLVCPNSKLRQGLNDKLNLPRWNVVQAGTGAGALEMLEQFGADDGILLLDPNLPDMGLNDFLDIVEVGYPNLQLITLDSETGQLTRTRAGFIHKSPS
jgi:DNA-binding response OmpR family regulator